MSIEIKYLHVLVPMELEWEEDSQPKRGIVFIDFVRDNIYTLSGEPVLEEIKSKLLPIIKERKNSVLSPKIPEAAIQKAAELRKKS